MRRVWKKRRLPGAAVAGLLMCLSIAAACSAPTPEAARPAAGPAAAATPTPAPTPAADRWSSLLAATPYPYLLSLPRETASALDGTYAMVEPAETGQVHCLRCPDYAPAGGVWKLHLSRGVFRIFHAETGWRSLGSFVVTRDRVSKVEFPDRLLLFNDPHCPDVVGMYTWKLEEGSLRLEVVDDTCSYQLRAANLTGMPWLSCQPPNAEAGITDHWPKPAGCD
jgi:hypothetical protein